MANWTQSGGVDISGTSFPKASISVSPGEFRFSFQPLQALTGATPVTLTLNPFPLGITETSDDAATPHYLRITDGVGGNENVLITARTSTSVTFTPASSHVSGNWKIGSATNGIQEAIKWVESLSNGGSVKLEFGNSTVYKTISFSGSPAVSLEGHGWWDSIVLADSTFSTGDIFYCEGTTQLLQFRNLHIARNVTSASGAGIHVKNSGILGGVIQNVKIENCYIGLDFESSGGYTVIGYDYTQSQAANPSAHAGVYIHGSAGAGGDMTFVGGHVESEQTNSANMLTYGFRIEAADGIEISGFVVRAEYGLSVYGLNGKQIGSVSVHGCTIDNCRINNVQIVCDPTPTLFTNISVSDCKLIGTLTNAESVVVVNNATATTYIGVTLTDNFILGAVGDGLFSNNVRGLILSNNQILDNNTSVTGGGCAARIFNVSDLTMEGNLLSDTQGSPRQSYGLVLAGTLTRATITGNNFYGFASASINNLASPIVDTLIFNNGGVDQSVPTVASAATVTIPATQPSIMIISGTTGINTIAGASGTGHRLTLLMQGAVTFSGGNQARSFGPTVAGQKVECLYVSSTNKWYLS